MAPNPTNHAPHRRRGRSDPFEGALSAKLVCDAVPAMGAVSGATANSIAATGSLPVDAFHSKWVPRLTKRANGMKNFTEALSHSQYRTAARFLRNAKANNATATAKSVDCQR